MFAIAASDISILAAGFGVVTPLVGSFLLVIKWITNFQREITDKYREELRETRKEFDEYKLSTAKKITQLEIRLDSLVDLLEEEQANKANIITHLANKGITLPPELDRRKVTR
jgi:hypothetical protein